MHYCGVCQWRRGGGLLDIQYCSLVCVFSGFPCLQNCNFIPGMLELIQDGLRL